MTKPAPAFKRPEIKEGAELIHHGHSLGRDNRRIARVIRRTATRLVVDIDGFFQPGTFSADSLCIPGADRWNSEQLEVPRDAAHLAEVREESYRRTLVSTIERAQWRELPTEVLRSVVAVLGG